MDFVTAVRELARSHLASGKEKEPMEENQLPAEATAVFDIFFLDADGFECHLKLTGENTSALLARGREAAANILELGGRPRKNSPLSARRSESRFEDRGRRLRALH
jgi:hypothetical protein